MENSFSTSPGITVYSIQIVLDYLKGFKNSLVSIFRMLAISMVNVH